MPQRPFIIWRRPRGSFDVPEVFICSHVPFLSITCSFLNWDINIFKDTVHKLSDRQKENSDFSYSIQKATKSSDDRETVSMETKNSKSNREGFNIIYIYITGRTFTDETMRTSVSISVRIALSTLYKKSLNFRSSLSQGRWWLSDSWRINVIGEKMFVAFQSLKWGQEKILSILFWPVCSCHGWLCVKTGVRVPSSGWSAVGISI